MARPLSEDKRNAILDSAMHLIAEKGPGASTADIAKRAGLPTGSLFTYFDTKAELYNALYRNLKSEVAAAVLADMPENDDVEKKLYHLWSAWTRWGALNTVARKALAQLTISDLVTTESREAGMKAAASTVEIVRQASVRGLMGKAPSHYVGALVESMANTTMDFMLADPTRAEDISHSGFLALRQMLT
jgi:AcrR family transcriptional regulator